MKLSFGSLGLRPTRREFVARAIGSFVLVGRRWWSARLTSPARLSATSRPVPPKITPERSHHEFSRRVSVRRIFRQLRTLERVLLFHARRAYQRYFVRNYSGPLCFSPQRHRGHGEKKDSSVSPWSIRIPSASRQGYLNSYLCSLVAPDWMANIYLKWLVHSEMPALPRQCTSTDKNGPRVQQRIPV